MTKPLVYATSAVGAALLIAIGVRQFRGSNTDAAADHPGPRVRMDSTSKNSGWRVRTDGSNSASTGAVSVPGNAKQADRDAATGATSGVDSPGPSDRGTAQRLSATGQARGVVADGVGGGSIRAGSTVEIASGPFDGTQAPGRRSAQDANHGASTSTTTVATEANAAAAADPATASADDSGVILSLPLKNSSDPEHGDAAVVEQGVSFETGEGATFSTDAQFIVPNGGNIKGESGAISFWVEPNWEGGDGKDASFVQLRNQNVWENRLQIFKNGDYLRFLMTDGQGMESNIGMRVDTWQPGDRHFVTASWTGDTQQFYVDGALVGEVPLKNQLNVQPGTPLYIGSDIPTAGFAGANSTLGDFKVYDRPLTASEVAANSVRR